LFKVKKERVQIIHENTFWEFIKICFKQPRRTLRNNLAQSPYQLNLFDAQTLAKRAQQLTMQELLVLWNRLQS
jgi:16S rRNA A1518/A1519 N6-dimethyltransferase RsmA/KsgA/DIM1 with predicted DNA glycosylase/AP lyase activity